MKFLSERSRKKHCFQEKRVRDITNKYEKIECIGKLFGRDRKRKTTTTTADRTIQRILKKDRRTSAEKVVAKIKKQLDILLSAQNVRNRAHEIGMFGRVARKKPYVNKRNVLSSLRKCYRNRWIFGKLLCGLTNQNSNLSARRIE